MLGHACFYGICLQRILLQAMAFSMDSNFGGTRRKWYFEEAPSPVDGDGAAITHSIMAWNGIGYTVRLFN